MREAADYETLVKAATPLTVAEPPSKPIPEEVARLAEAEKLLAGVAADLAKGKKQSGATGLVQWARRQCPAFLLSLNNLWFGCVVRHAPNGMLSIYDATNGIAGGMSGSPIIAEDGTAIGIVCLGSGEPDGPLPTEGGPNPRLMGNLPGWFLKNLEAAAA